MLSVRSIVSTVIILAGCTLFYTVTAVSLPSTVSPSQWRDSYLAKWQSGDSMDKRDAVQQLSALLLLVSPADPITEILMDRLKMHTADAPDAQMALAISALSDGRHQQASRLLLELILQYPEDPRINRFRIALARAFRAGGQHDLAAAQLEPLVTTATTDGQWAMLEKAFLLMDTGNFENAIHILTELTRAGSISDYLSERVKSALTSAGTQRMLSDGAVIE